MAKGIEVWQDEQRWLSRIENFAIWPASMHMHGTWISSKIWLDFTIQSYYFWLTSEKKKEKKNICAISSLMQIGALLDKPEIVVPVCKINVVLFILKPTNHVHQTIKPNSYHQTWWLVSIKQKDTHENVKKGNKCF